MLTEQQKMDAVAYRREGMTYQEIANKIGGISHEGIRVRITRLVKEGLAEPELLGQARGVSRTERAKEITAWLNERGTATRGEVMEEFSLSSSQLNGLMPMIPRHLVIFNSKVREDTYTDEQLYDSIRRAWKAMQKYDMDAKGLSHAFYEKVRRLDDPSSARILTRCGTWVLACEAAGVPCGERNRAESSYVSKWSDEDILESIRLFVDYCAETSIRPTYSAYDRWQRADEESPSGSLVRTRMRSIGLNGWSDIIRAATVRGAVTGAEEAS